ncbi:50S ribosomal protein L9 [Aquisphaera giovannonii]|uniref:Large ribosomal subunit protein bL9 n=1 Tax=Aquisphaera giovannonii TaxID=406548 RepID=A0A5B9W0N7_9BACT|nr:50S ribosomal protein L9 [Aquisphaera giovannonii]QEH34176.1 50S ribosomal protein L9 [Aquisphaera giovannonii]
MAKSASSAGGKTKPKSKKASPKKGTGKHHDAPHAKAAVAEAPRQPGVERRKNHPLRAKDGHISVLLTRSVTHVGQTGELVKVRPGFARNYLLPQGLATFATPHNLRIVEKHRERLRQLEEARRADLQNLGAQISQRTITIDANANEDGHLYGSVNADQIAAALKAEGFPVETENVRIEGPLKDLGFYTIRIVLGQDIESEAKLWVVPTHTEEHA